MGEGEKGVVSYTSHLNVKAMKIGIKVVLHIYLSFEPF